MKKLLSKLLAALFAVTLISCGSNQTDTVESQLSTGVAVSTKAADFGKAASPETIVAMSEKLGAYFNGKNASKPQALTGSADSIGYKSATASVNASSTATPMIAASNVASPVFRFYNINTGAHFFTMSAAERDYVKNTFPFFTFEGNSFFAYPDSDSTLSPVYRFYNKVTGTHFFTISPEEKAYVQATWPEIFNYEGISWHASADVRTGWVPVYRFFNTKTSTHFYTTSAAERDYVKATWNWFTFEGIAYYVLEGVPVEPVVVQSLTLTPSVVGAIPAGVASSLAAAASLSNGTTSNVTNTSTWASSNTAVATVSSTGAITAITPGTAQITANFGGQSASYNLTVVNAVVTGLSINVVTTGFTAQPSVFPQGDVRTLEMKARYSNSNGAFTLVTGTWSSSAPSIASVDASGVLRTLSPGTTAIVASYGGITTVKNVTVATPLAAPLITITCNAAAPMVISASTWNSAYATDPKNTTKWIATDWASCGTRPVIQLIYKASASSNSGYRVFQAAASPSNSFYPGEVSTSGSTPQLSAGSVIDVAYVSAVGNIIYNLIYTVTVQ